MLLTCPGKKEEGKKRTMMHGKKKDYGNYMMMAGPLAPNESSCHVNSEVFVPMWDLLLWNGVLWQLFFFLSGEGRDVSAEVLFPTQNMKKGKTTVSSVPNLPRHWRGKELSAVAAPSHR